MSGELVETPWAALNRLQASTSVMNQGHRVDTLSDNLNHWNWTKVTRMCESILSSLMYQLECQSCLAGDRIVEDFKQSRQKRWYAEAALEDIKLALGKERTATLEANSAASDSSQYRPDPNKIKCCLTLTFSAT